MEKLSTSDRRGIASALATASLACLIWAFPDMSRFFTIPGAMVFLCLTVYFFWPDIRGLGASRPGGFKRMWPQYLMVFAGCLFFVGLVAFLQINVEKPNADDLAAVHDLPKPSPKTSASISPPSLLTLFMTDFKRRDGMIWDATADVDIVRGGQKVGSYRLFYKILNDFVANSKFIAFFVPETVETASAMSFLAENYQGYFTDIEKQHWAVAGSPGMSDVINTKDLPFSGRLYVYHEAPYSLEQLAAYAKLFREHGATVQFRGPEYIVAVWQSIRAGDVKPLPTYTIIDGIPKETSPAP